MSQIIAPVHVKQIGWPSFWGPQALKEYHELIRDRAFQRGFRQKPQSDEDLIFPHLTDPEDAIFRYGKNWREISDPEYKTWTEQNPWTEDNKRDDYYVAPEWPRYTGCDLSGKGRRGTVIFTLAMSPAGTRHVLDIKIGSWGAGPEFVRQLQAVNDTPHLKPRRIFVENNALQEAVIDNIREMGGEFGGKVYPFRTGTNKMDPEIGLPGIDAQYEQKRWKIGIPHKRNSPSYPDKKNPTLCLCGICTLIRDASTLTADDLKETPDTVAAQFIAKEASRQGERYSETSANVVKMTQKDMQQKISSMRDPMKSRSLRIPVGDGRHSPKDDPWGKQTGPHPDPSVKHETGTCVQCDRFLSR